MGLAQAIGQGLLTCDSFGGVRRLITPPSRRRGVMRQQPLTPAGRWSRFRSAPHAQPALPLVDAAASGANSAPGAAPDDALIEFAARQLLLRYGVVFRALIERERMPIAWRDLVRVYRHLELRGDVRGGRFVQRFAGEQYALPEAIELMRRIRRKKAAREGTMGLASAMAPSAGADVHVSAADPLNLEGILTPESRIAPQLRRRVRVG